MTPYLDMMAVGVGDLRCLGVEKEGRQDLEVYFLLPSFQVREGRGMETGQEALLPPICLIMTNTINTVEGHNHHPVGGACPKHVGRPQCGVGCTTDTTWTRPTPGRTRGKRRGARRRTNCGERARRTKRSPMNGRSRILLNVCNALEPSKNFQRQAGRGLRR